MEHASLTIAAAARHCGVHRRTLQRAIRAGRLRLTPDAQLTIAALTQAGYTAATPQRLPRARPGDTPHLTAGDTAPHDAVAPQGTPQAMDRIAEALTSIATSLSVLCARLTPQGHAAPGTAATPQVAPQRLPRARPGDTPHVTPQMFDATKYRLGRLCPRGHDYEGTGESLRVNNKAGYCMACNAEDSRARRQAKRQASPAP